jgi:hypothetical protein
VSSSIPHSLTLECGANHYDRAHSIVLPDYDQPTRDLVLSTRSGSGGCVFDVLVASDCAFRPERTKRGFDHRIPRWDDDLPVVVCLLSVFEHT